MKNYWNKRFETGEFVWGIEPSKVAINCENYFKAYNVNNVLIMGFVYGRNGKYLVNKGYNVEGVEYSKNAIILGKKFCSNINYIEGSVLDIKINKKYDVVFCYSILHLFTKNDRIKLIENCINHCKENGLIIFSCISIKDKTFGIGKKIEENTFEIREGKIVHFYCEDDIKNLHEKLENISYDYVNEKIKSYEQKDEEYKMIYGIYKLKERKTSA